KEQLQKGVRGSSELDIYLRDVDDAINEDDDDKKFNILKWWSRNSVRYPVLSEMVRDILAVPISSVASESAFSCGGRVLSPFRSSLNSNIVEALICAEDWIRYECGKNSGQVDDKEEDQEQIDYERVTSTFEARMESVGDMPSNIPIVVEEEDGDGEEEKEEEEKEEEEEDEEDEAEDEEEDDNDVLLNTLKKQGCADVGGSRHISDGGASGQS
ncbi:unnamed protein product, partial [Linum tenue]